MYTIKEASARSGVGVPLLRAWERRYGVVSPTRTPSGYRLYDEEAIERLTAMRELIAQGWSAQQAAERVRSAGVDELATIAPLASSAAPDLLGTDGDGQAREEVARRLVAAARLLDGPALHAALDDTFSVVRFERAVDDVLMPALRAIGEAWERGEVTVAGEHATSEAISRRLAAAYEAAGIPHGDRPILVGLGPGARHEFGALAFATAARRAGLPVLYLGADLPVESWVSAAVERDARAAVIGVARRPDAERAEEVVKALREERPGMVVAVGGGHAARVASRSGAIELPAAMDDAVARLANELADERSATS